MTPGKGARLEYLDALRGLAILLVVYVHLVNYGYFNLNQEWTKCAWSPAVTGLKFRMPLFFFVSGLLACGVYDAANFRKRVANRLRRQLWPTIVVCLLFNGFCHWDGRLHTLVYNSHNDCYWFTQSLVQVFIVYAVAARCLHALHASRKTETVAWAVMAALLLGCEIWIESMGKLPKYHFLRYTYLVRTVIYGQFFFLGVIARMRQDKFLLIFSKKWPWFIAVAYFTAGCIFDFGYVSLPTRAAGVLAIYGLFVYTRKYWASGGRVAAFMAFLGRNTLPVYLYHYIALHILMEHGWLTGGKALYGGWMEIPVTALLALSLTLACLGADLALKKGLKPVHALVYGSPRRKPQPSRA